MSLEVLLRYGGVATMGGQIALHKTAAALHKRHAVVPEDFLDLVLLILHGKFEHVFEESIGLAHARSDVEFKGHGVFPKTHRLNWDGRAFRFDPAGERSPNRRHVEIAVDDLLHLIPGLIFRLEVGIVGNDVKLQIGDAVLYQRLADARWCKTPH